MKKINNKGFTLIELIATLVILSLVIGLASYSITTMISNSKEKNYNLLITEIKNATELYYQECKFSQNSAIICPSFESNNYEIELADLVTYGFLKANSTDVNDNAILVNPKDNKYIGDCKIRYQYFEGKLMFDYDNSANSSCPELR